MKAEILKIAGVKSEKEFYKKFPTEESFQKAYGKEFRKAKLGSSMGISKAQKGKSMEQLASEKQKCGITDYYDKEARKSAKEFAKIPDAVVIPEWNEISNIENLGLDKQGKKQLQKDFEAIKSKYPGLDLPTYIAAVRDAGRTSIQFANPERTKSFDPITGALLPNVDRRNVDPYLRFYRGQFPTQSKISPTDVLDVFSKMPGGFSNYSKYANVGYVPPMQKQGGQTKKLKQLTSYEGDIDNVIPKAQVGNVVNDCPTGLVWSEDLQMCVQDTGYDSSQESKKNQPAVPIVNSSGQVVGGPASAGKASNVAETVVSGGKTDLLGKLGGTAGITQTAGELIEGIQQLKQEKKLRKQTEQGKRVSELTLQASGTRPEQQRRRYNRPEDALIQPNQLFPSYGVGTNYLAKDGVTLKAEDGMQIGGNLTEIQNTYAPNTLYDNLGFEPLNESDIIKRYYGGGYVPKAQGGFEQFMSAGGEDVVNKGIDAIFAGGNAGGKIGGALGKTAGNLIGGPVGGMIGGAVGKIAGNLLDTNTKKIKKNQEAMLKNLQIAGMQSGMQSLQQGQYSSYVKNGGLVKAQYGIEVVPSPVNYRTAPYNLEHFTKYVPEFRETYGAPRVTEGDTYDEMYQSLQKRGVPRQEAANIMSFLNKYYDPQGNLKTNPFISIYPYDTDDSSMKSYENGGWMSHDWQPQVITHFGEHRVSDLLRKDPTMDTLRTGGNIRQNNMYPQDQFNFGGELQTTWGGYAEPISQNPYLPGTGQTVMFRGNSHEEADRKGRTGIGVKYGNDGEYSPYMEYGKDGVEDVTDVEVEDGEPAVQLPDTNSQNQSSKFALGGEADNKDLSMNVFGNLIVSKLASAKYGGKGKKYKNVVKDLSEETTRINKKKDKAVKELSNLDVSSPFDKLKLASYQAMLTGNNMKLKTIADDIQDLAISQNAYNETAEEYGLDADALARGKMKIDKEAMKQTAQNGREIPKAQKGTKYTGSSIVEYLKSVGQPIDMNYRKKLAEERGIKNYRGTITQNEQLLKKLRDEESPLLNPIKLTRPSTDEELQLTPDEQKQLLAEKEQEQNYQNWLSDPRNELAVSSLGDDFHDRFKIEKPVYDPNKTYKPFVAPNNQLNLSKKEEKKKNKYQDWITVANTLIPYFRPTNQEPLDPNQLMGEMFALSANTLEPVPMQTFQPQLLTPYDVSYQDQLNEITAQSRDAMRMAQGDPSALAAISAQAELAKSKVLGEQFRQNQAQRMGVYNQNINTLNQAQLQNLALYDKQYERQATARSKTKATAQEALSSIADKIARNKLENRTLGIYENLYNYRFDPQGRAINMNPLAQFDFTGSGASSSELPIVPGYEWDTTPSLKKKKKSEDTGRNGKIVRAIKNL